MADGMKKTRQRQAILRVLSQKGEPLTAEEISVEVLGEMPGMALSTVYRNLERFEQAGQIESVTLDDNIARYFLRKEKHGHYMICTVCRACVRIDDCPLKALERRLEKDTGYEISGHNLTILGRCPECRKKQRAEEGEKSV